MMFVDFFFFNDTATTEIYTLSLHDALPISFARSASAITSRTESTATVTSAFPNSVLAATFSINCCFVILLEFNGLRGEALRSYSPRQREQTRPARLSSDWKAFLGGVVGRAMAGWPKVWQ